jgi:tetratricopeptide (TPR) repeat protein
LEKAFGPNHFEVSKVLYNSAVLQHAQKRFGEAEHLYKRALAIWERAALANRHRPFMLAALKNLGGLYRSQQRYGEAKLLSQPALEICRETFGPDHPQLADILIGMATLCLEEGQQTQAEPRCKQAVEIHSKAFGPGDPRRARAVHMLAEIYRAQGRYGEVGPPDRPEIGAVLSNLGALRCVQGSYDEVEKLYQRALAVWQKTLDPLDSRWATTMMNLGELYRVLGKYGEAQALLEQALAIWEKAPASSRQEKAMRYSSLAGVYRAQKKFDQAEQLCAR